ncbi:MAG: CBS domain-containing protein [Thaumarchaeota archaeon]|nr:CBS domain-containing protein [Nitrososphaerota archaeon]
MSRKGDGIPIYRYSLTDLLQNSLLSSPAVSVSYDDKITEATHLLPEYLESFTDSLVVVRDERPVGLIGGLEILDGVLKQPCNDFFEKTRVKDVMNNELIKLESGATLGSLLNVWRRTGRAFAIVPNQYHGYSAISARKVLEVGMKSKTELTVEGISRKRLLTFTKDQTVREILESMFENRTRKLVLEGTAKFISDRIIIQRISRDLNCLEQCDDFLEMRAGGFHLDEAKSVTGSTSLVDACKIMYGMQSPYLHFPGGVVTPWDVIMSFDSGKVYLG